jgi:hypothetical protein
MPLDPTELLKHASRGANYFIVSGARREYGAVLRECLIDVNHVEFPKPEPIYNMVAHDVHQLPQLALTPDIVR